jgi:hypothetical protein
MVTYAKTQKDGTFKKISVLKGDDGKRKREESDPSSEEYSILENHYDNITANLTDYETLISFDVNNIENLDGILNYRNSKGDHKQLRY